MLLILQTLAVSGQAFAQLAVNDDDVDLAELEGTPFMLSSGIAYRDMLTIGASQAVAQFAGRYQPEERQRVREKIWKISI